jgi:hypothetical protein
LCESCLIIYSSDKLRHLTFSISLIPEDAISQKIWKKILTPTQVFADTGRNCFLCSNWYVTVAPWGYRNEIHYKLNNGKLLDIATLEILTHFPDIEISTPRNKITKINEWDKRLLIDGFGFERMVLALNQDKYDSIFKVVHNNSDINSKEYEIIRILQRIITDLNNAELESDKMSKNRNNKLNHLINAIVHLEEDIVGDILDYQANLYNNIYPELKSLLSITKSKLLDLIKFKIKFKRLA